MSKFPTNLEIAELLRDVASSYQYKEEKRSYFKIVAYQRAADAVEHATSELKDLWDDARIADVPGIGPSIAEHLNELFKTGKSKHFESVMEGIPKEAFKLMKLPGIGIKTAMKLIKEGDKKIIKEKLLEVEKIEKKVKRHLLPYASEVASSVIDYLLTNDKVIRADALGSLRRKVSTIGDIDIAIVTNEGESVLTFFTKYPNTQKIIEKGTHSASIIVAGGIQVDAMVQPQESYGSLLQHFTGSKHHNIALRDYALKQRLSLSEYGIRYSNKKEGKVKKFSNEKDFYKYLGLSYIEPELREDTGEIEAAKVNKLPKLITLEDIKADLQIHSSFDVETSHDLGESSMEEIIAKGNSLGYEYLAFTEHNPSQKGHNENDVVEILKRKREKVDKINYSLTAGGNKGVKKVFNSLEIDIKSDGSLPVSESGLLLLDFALVSIHSNFNLDRDSQTKRVLRALENPKVKIFAHPTGRKLEEREGVELNWPEIFNFSLKHNKWIEVNCDPARLDLPDSLVREAVKLGIKFTFGTDSHHADSMDNMIWGLSVARRGWCEPRDIMNTQSLSEFEKSLKGGD